MWSIRSLSSAFICDYIILTMMTIASCNSESDKELLRLRLLRLILALIQKRPTQALLLYIASAVSSFKKACHNSEYEERNV